MSNRAPAACTTFDAQQLGLADAQPIGSGAVSHVVRSTLSFPHRTPIAVKILSKVQLLQQSKVQSAMNEKRVLVEMGPHPFIARLYGTSQSTDELYFVMEYLPHGDLLEHIRTRVARRTAVGLTEEAALTTSLQRGTSHSNMSIPCLDFHDIQLITAQILVGLAHVFAKGFVLRDLKPENIAFDSKYRVCLLDFDTVDVEGMTQLPHSNKGVALCNGSTREKMGEPKRRLTVSSIQSMRKMTAHFCGTAQYVSPEMIGQCKWSYSSDLWALGTIVYEMVYGTHMFPGCNTFAVMKRVVAGVQCGEVPFPQVDLGPETDAFERVKDFILKLCCTDPTQRLGVDPETGLFDEEAVRRHPLFGDFSWEVLDEHVKSYRPPVVNPPAAGATTAKKTIETAATEPVGLACGPAALGPLPPQVLDDGTASLESHYHTLPVHDPEYARYVFAATADANPFEQWARAASGDTRGDGAQETSSHEGGCKCGASENSDDARVDANDEESDVIDDVGVRFFGNVHPDFADVV
ncbi:putative protein kinase [Trypanosoma grayi]|uniref:putative protein kinase n=1 Tax=Trypanosoma grayi TaxID=71804 RepID=UPI0004F47556|nr:putative protein kinase [Trypanosoma grayi]KEG13492.1 putative protein kinase [Trypanosoma grayi]